MVVNEADVSRFVLHCNSLSGSENAFIIQECAVQALCLLLPHIKDKYGK